jgi:hypothetical protein
LITHKGPTAAIVVVEEITDIKKEAIIDYYRATVPAIKRISAIDDLNVNVGVRTSVIIIDSGVQISEAQICESRATRIQA